MWTGSQGTFGFVGFHSDRDAEDARRALDHHELHGERLRVERTRDSMRPVVASSGPGSHPFTPNERCYNCGQYGHWYAHTQSERERERVRVPTARAYTHT
jgi:RNA recognition motif-containing protein